MENKNLELNKEDGLDLQSQETNPEIDVQPMNQEPNMQAQPMNQEPNMQAQQVNQEANMQVQQMNQEPNMQAQPMNQEPNMQAQPMNQEANMQAQPMNQYPNTPVPTAKVKKKKIPKSMRLKTNKFFILILAAAIVVSVLIVGAGKKMMTANTWDKGREILVEDYANLFESGDVSVKFEPSWNNLFYTRTGTSEYLVVNTDTVKYVVVNDNGNIYTTIGGLSLPYLSTEEATNVLTSKENKFIEYLTQYGKDISSKESFVDESNDDYYVYRFLESENNFNSGVVIIIAKDKSMIILETSIFKVTYTNTYTEDYTKKV